MKLDGWDIFFLILIVVLSAVDIASNVFALIPFIGGVFETLSESIIEAIQIILALIIALKR